MPYIVVEHFKEGRAHRHVIWSRVDEDLRTVSPFYNFLTHERTARELEREFGLERLVENGRARETIQLTGYSDIDFRGKVLRMTMEGSCALP